jgi:hypothetical protein
MAAATAAVVLSAQSTASLDELVNRSYLDLAEAAPQLQFSKSELNVFRKELDRQRKAEDARLKREAQELERSLKDLRDQLRSLNREASADTPRAAEVRREIHCKILALEKQLREKELERKQGMPVSFDNKYAKVDLVEKWPARKAEVLRQVAEGKARQRPFGDVEDIGLREVGKDQEKDIKLGEDALRDMKTYHLMPPEVDDKAVTTFVEDVALRIARNSDVRVPVKLTVLRSEEINAFALPGGFLFVNTGLLQKAQTEAELAGVIAHELAHVSGRHGARLLKRANIANLMYQMAQVAVMIGTGGFGTIGTYYLMQAGFFGLGMVLNLSLLGVSREFEMEADQLGTQYAWKAGYDPRGFISFFDKMASEKGYVQSASFFRTHPPFFDRIVSTLSEIAYLPAREALALDSSRFEAFQRDLAAALEKGKAEDERRRPTLRRDPDCEEDPKKPRSELQVPAFCLAC